MGPTPYCTTRIFFRTVLHLASLRARPLVHLHHELLRIPQSQARFNYLGAVAVADALRTQDNFGDVSRTMNCWPRLRSLFFLVPLGTLAGAYAWIGWATGDAWSWQRVVHEDGQRTLLNTVFYFEHALRELPLDALLAWAVAAAAAHFYPQTRLDTNERSTGLRLSAVVSALLLVGIVAGTWVTAGADAVAQNLAQMHTRPGASLAWGAHWRYHVLERLALLLASFALFGLLANERQRSTTKATPLYLGSLAGFLLLTFFFGLTTEPFADTRYLGHQARELFTHGLITLPLAVGACLILTENIPASSAGRRTGRMRSVWLACAASGLLGAYVSFGALLTGASQQAQTHELHRLVAAHVFEHALSYVLVVTGSVCFYLWWAKPKVLATAAPRIVSSYPWRNEGQKESEDVFFA